MVSQQPELIAIVGSGCRFPGGANSPSSLWELLQNPRDVLKDISLDRFDPRGYYHPDGIHHGTTNVRQSYLLDEDLRVFDSTFFNISPNEADSMDPQQRLLLETVYEALESGGHTIESLAGSDTAVYVGNMAVDYHDTLFRDLNSLPTYFATGTARSILSNRISYFFDWRGPSITIDTACSSSLIAVHQSVQALRMGETRVAVACGTQLILGPENYVAESKINLLSPTSRSRMWDADVDGYARGEGVATVVLKRLSDAIADGDHIECLIRGTGTNQDGRSAGLTVPSSESQAALIANTYARAGLDLGNARDWPQYFEAHGTGTRVGDPKEAGAISACFPTSGRNADDGPLYVGSIKTVIGHTEGTAGIAGLLKGSLAIQHGVIPPNLLFHTLNPDIKPFYQGLNVPTRAKPWPTLAESAPRRVSVNSFGFGGANAHAILEQYQPPASDNVPRDAAPIPWTPFTFSAVSEGSLVAQLEAYSEFLKRQNALDPFDLAWTLQSRRSQFSVKAAFSAPTIEQLAANIDEKLILAKQTAGTNIGNRSTPASPHILGIFTGQGAQWATMGGNLIRSSLFVRERIQYLQNSLATLPASDRPQWHLEKELLAGADTSRLSEALLSQPLCTAVQIVLVDLLQAAGITFDSVVGHSSGEIAAAYAADFISAHDAIRIAYYRGLHAQLAGDPSGQRGAMLAVGTSWEDAQDLLHLPVFRARLNIAAHNSSASVTLSGNADAIVHAKKVFDEEKKFTRLLKVDTAYHSHHMLPCGDAYIQSLQACEIRVNRERNTSCSWYSSVISGKRMEPDESVRDIYWKDNMENPVLFAEAVKSAVSEQLLNLTLEIGPHPALKGPATQNISEVRSVLPYSGVLSRGNSDIETFSDALGFVWTHLGSAAVDFSSYQKAAASVEACPKLLTGLPSYQWNRGRSYWHESRRSRKIRTRPEAFHELLGVPSPDSTDGDRRWTNLLKVSEIPWLDGHRLQGQAVFPGSGYVAMALEAAKRLAGSRAVALFEIHDLVIPKAMTFEDDANFGVETLFTLRAITPNSSRDDQIQTAEFCCYICQNSGSDEMELIASGKVKIVFGSPSGTTLSSTPLEVSNMAAIDVDRFYSSLEALNYSYTGPFRTMSSLKRRLDQASALVSTYPYVDGASSYLVHPAVLDTSFQAALLAQSAPGDDRLWSLHVPTSIRCIRVNPELCTSLPTSMTQLPMCAVLHEPKSKSICGSVDIFTEDGQQTLIQVEELTMIPFGPTTIADDRRLFSYTKWDFAVPEGTSIVGHERPSLDEVQLATLCERLSYFYLRKWKSEITDEEWTSGQRHCQSLRNFMDHTLSSVSGGRHPYIKKEWSNDTVDVIDALIHNHPESVDMKLISAVGNNIPAVVRGQTTMLEHMLQDNMLDDLYKKGLGFVKYNSFLAKMVQQITHRYPHTKILEIGAGTGGATKTVLESIGNTFSSYTYTDISAGFFEKAAELFKDYCDKITFKILDIENTPTTQGFGAHSYDIIIASNVLHATSSLHKTLENTRRLLKPGGFLLLLEITNNGPIRYTNMMGGLPGWWVGVDDGRQYAATTTPAVWHNTLRKSGFSGVDATITREVDGLVWPFSIIATQAVNDRVDFLRRPLSHSSSFIYIDSLVILGTGSLETARIAEEVAELLEKFCSKINILEGLPTKADAIAPMSTFINLVDIDSPIFKNMTEEKMEGLRRLLELSKHILWLTAGAQADNPYHESSIAFSRAIGHEMPHILLNHLDVSDLASNVPTVIAEYILRQCALDEWDASTHQLLWSKEPEIHLDRGQLKVPRIVGHTDQNLRLNSARRVVTKTVSTSTSNVSIMQSTDSPPYLLEEILPVAPEGGESVIRVEKSSLMALNVAPDTFLFLSIGKTNPTRDTVLALSTTNSSMTVPIASVKLGADVDTSLVAVASELLAESLLSTMSSGSKLLIHEGSQDGFFAAALARRAAMKEIHITFSTVRIHAPDPAWVKLNTGAPTHAIRRMLPANLTHCLDMTVHLESNFNIATVLPSACRRLDLSNLFQCQSLQPTGGRELTQVRLEAVAGVTISQEPQHLVIPLRQVSDTSIPKHPTTVIIWGPDDALSVQVRPLDAGRLFSRDKTYLLIGLSGLTGQLGQSLCEWMIRNGAGYVCLASRNPNIDTRWLESFQGTGGIVKIFALDITDRNSLKSVVDEIRATCPPIAGIANAAMVLHDEMFSTMSLDKMQSALRPKIDGTNNLDELFYKDKLDFFILFSSLARVVGNSGQANYAAATGYLASLARQRRKRGVAGSTFDMGRVVGAGYVERAGQAVVDQLNKYGYMAISESEFHTMFAETIRAGYPELGAYPVVTTGLRLIRDDEEIKGPWFENPRFSHCILETRAVDAKQDDKKTTLHVSERLSNAANMEEVLEVIQESFSAKLRVILHISDEAAIDRFAPLSELGIDSLVAVEVRSWFLKELKVDMPVLKVLGGGSVANLSEYVIDKLPEKLLSSIEGGPAKAEVKQSKPESESQGADSTFASASVPPTSSSPDESVTGSSSPCSADLMALAKPSTSLPELIFSKSEQISFAQSRFWFLRLLLEDQTTFNVAFYYQVTGNLRIKDLDRAIRALGTRHEALRTCFIGDESKADLAHQKVMNNSPLRLEHKNISRVEDVAVEYANLKAHAFDIASGDLMRVILLTLSPTSHYLLFNYHHILMDGASYQIFLTELERVYNGAPLGAPPRQFPDFSRSQREAFESGKMNDELQFWREVFPDEPPILPLLPMARVSSRMPMERFDIHQVEYHFDPGTAARVKSVAKAQRSTSFHFYLAAFKLMLFSFTDAEDLTIGIADANRNDSDVMDTIGFFLNLLTLRFSRQAEQRFTDAITEARNTTYAALENSRLPFDVLLKELNVPRSSAYSPFFQAFFDYRHGVQTKHTWSNCQFEVQEINPGRTAYDITLDVTDGTTGALVMFRAQKGLYDLAATQLLLRTYVHLVDVLSSNTSLLLKDTPLFSEKELTHALGLGRGPNLTSSWPETLPHRIDQVAEKNQDKVALVDGTERVLTYANMIDRIEAIAEALKNVGIGEGSRVLVFEDATADWPCSMLAIMRIGAVYVPLDLRNPLPRLADIAANCQPAAILVDDSTVSKAPEVNITGAQVVNVSRVNSKPSARVLNVARAGYVAAILHSSGSTGKPKGIIVTHSGLRNEIEGYTTHWGLKAERVLQQSSFTFNHSSDQIYTGLVNAGMVHIVPWDKRGDALEITKIIQQQKITYTKATPSEYSMWIQYGGDNLRKASNWRFAFGGGEPLTSTVTQEFAGLSLPFLRFFNSYGPTEISISSHKSEVAYREKAHEGPIPCGYSLPNYVTYILDDQLKPLPAGMPGEVVIGGAGVSLGYLNNKELTDLQFVPDPYATPEYVANGWTKMYRTSDIGHLQDDGAMVFHNRIAGDTQVKIRGLRIELTDIETNVLSTAGGILRDAVVTLRGVDSQFLVAHVVFAPHNEVTDREAFLQHLLSHLPLPQYMIPVLAIPLENLPLTNHSKVDRKAIKDLPLPQRTKSTEDDLDLELTETMVQLKRLWQDVLGNQGFDFDITPSTSFFVVGGNSLLVIRLQSQIRDLFSVVVPLVALIGANTLSEMTQVIEESSTVDLIDWEKETTLSDISPSILSLANPHPIDSDQKTVLLTGATGFLAKYILPQLVASPNVRTIHCVAVRDKGPEIPRKLLISSSKIVGHRGNLAAPLLGLSEEAFQTLASDVDVILHMGAVRSFWDNYHVLRPTNVFSTRELIRLAAPRQIPIHYISTAGVLPRGAGSDSLAASVSAYVPATDGTDGYVATRWASERLLERAASELGLPTTVHRFIPSGPPNGGFELDGLVSFVDKLRIMPDFSGWEGRFDMFPAEQLAKWLCEALVEERPGDSKAATRFSHHVSPITINVGEMRTYLEQQRGDRGLERLPGLRWMGRIKSLGFGYFMASQEVTVESSVGAAGGIKFESRR